MIRLIVGLGNPGMEYEDTRHNAGFWWVDAAVRQLGGHLAHDRAYHGFVARVNRPEGPVWLLQPLTYMNLSGKAVAPLARFYKILPDEMLVVHDELDLPPGQMKLKQGGSAAGHNGLKDIHAQLGSQDFWRLRLGIGHPGTRGEVAAYVLRKPPASERELIERNIDDSLKTLDLMLAGQMDKAMQRIHARPPRPRPPRPDSVLSAGGDAPARTPPAAKGVPPAAPGNAPAANAGGAQELPPPTEGERPAAAKAPARVAAPPADPLPAQGVSRPRGADPGPAAADT